MNLFDSHVSVYVMSIIGISILIGIILFDFYILYRKKENKR